MERKKEKKGGKREKEGNKEKKCISVSVAATNSQLDRELMMASRKAHGCCDCDL